MPRKKKYTGKTLYREVEKYFKSISQTSAAMTDTGVLIYSDLGEPVQVVTYIVPPTVAGLCRYLGIDRRTWARYQDPEQHPEHQDAIHMAQDRMQEYLETELLSREKNIRGVMFNLQSNYGWRTRQEVELGGETRKAMAVESMSIEEKLRYISETQAMIDAGEDD